MSTERVQLKREDLVGDEIILSDINPKTSTLSVDDSSTGARLDQTIDRIWNAINNKLSRVVNSVNGRTGVVVLTPNDVGLDNVDNISFADIKQWVIDRLRAEFGNKRLKLFNSLNEMIAFVENNDHIYRDTTFFTYQGLDGDKKSYIGYIFLDPTTNKLSYQYMAINTVGYTDNSLIYDEKIDDERNFIGGGIGVNIYKYEDALEIYNAHSTNKGESGLRINKDNIVGKLYYFEGVYGDGTSTDENALFYFTDAPPDAIQCLISIDDGPRMWAQRVRKKGLKVGDLLICHFKDYRIDGVIPTGMASSMMSRTPCIGRVEQGPTTEHPETAYWFKFYTIRPQLGWGLQYSTTHKNTSYVDKSLTLKLATGYRDGMTDTGAGANVSGLQVYSNNGSPNPNDFTNTTKLTEKMRYTVLPEGASQVFTETNNSDGGLFIAPDMSLCVIPYNGYGPKSQQSNESNVVDNWSVTAPSDLSESSISNGALYDPCLLGVNLLKVTEPGTRDTESGKQSLIFTNASGLRISGPNTPLSVDLLGMRGTPNKGNITDIGDTTGGPLFNTTTSGGLSVNVGKFLEIQPGPTSYGENDSYYDGGKVNVRISRGLLDDNNNNKIGVDIGQYYTTKKGTPLPYGLYFTTGGSIAIKLRSQIGNSGGLKYDEDGYLVTAPRALTITDAKSNTVSFDTTSSIDIKLGEGLELVKSDKKSEWTIKLSDQ